MKNAINTLTKESISFEKILKGSLRNKILGKVVKAYHDGSSFTECEVVDTMAGMGMLVVLKNILPGVNGEHLRYKGFVTKNNVAIILGELSLKGYESFVELEAYESFLKNMEAPAEGFKPGLEIKLSPAVALRLKSVVSTLKEKEAGLAALLGKKKLVGSKDPEKKTAVFQSSGSEKMEEQGLSVKIDEKFMLTIVNMFETAGAEFFRIASGMAALLDFSGFKAKMRALEEEANKREKELNK